MLAQRPICEAHPSVLEVMKVIPRFRRANSCYRARGTPVSTSGIPDAEIALTVHEARGRRMTIEQSTALALEQSLVHPAIVGCNQHCLVSRGPSHIMLD